MEGATPLLCPCAVCLRSVLWGLWLACGAVAPFFRSSLVSGEGRIFVCMSDSPRPAAPASSPSTPGPFFTERLVLSRPAPTDLDDVFALNADPRLWTHFPSLVHSSEEQSREQLERWMLGWSRDGLGTWVVRSAGSGEVIGYGGCSVSRDAFWNLGYRFAFSAQGFGYATELAREAVAQARAARPELPVVAYLVEHNAGSAHVAEKVGLSLVHRAPDVGNPDPAVMRLVYADRPLRAEELAATLA